MALTLNSNELVTNVAAGIIYNGLNTAIRVRGTDTTSLALSGKNTTSNQIQFYTGTNPAPLCIAAFDVPGLVMADGYSMCLGTSTNYMKINHTGTSSSITYDTLSVSIAGTPIITCNPDSSVTSSKPLSTASLITCGKLSVGSINQTTVLTINGDVTYSAGIITALGPNFSALVAYIIQNIMNNNINSSNKPSS